MRNQLPRKAGLKEMRLEGVKNIASGNNFLERYLSIFNKRFNVEAISHEDLHRPLVAGVDLDSIFAVKTERALRKDFTVVHHGKLYQIKDAIRSDKVIVEDRLNGRRLITHKNRVLRYYAITQRPKKIQEPRKPHKPRVYVSPGMDNSWRIFRLRGSHKTQISEAAFAGAL
jgi:hypothetical protein